MYSRIFLRNNSFKVNTVSQAQVPQYFSQKFLLLTPTRVLRDPCDVRFFRTSKIHISSLRCAVCKHSGRILVKPKSYDFAFVRRLQSSSLDVNTNVTNNVFLYKYEKPRFFEFLNIFAPFQCIFWICIGYVLYKQLPKRDSNNQPSSKYAYDNFINIVLSSTAVIVGISSALLIWTFAAKSVKYVVLKKGGKAVTFITYHPLSQKASTTVPIEQISCKTARKEMNNYLPIKLKGRSFFYILDSDGEFMNPKLFDYTIGISRFSK